jgi:hypothetical protein
MTEQQPPDEDVEGHRRYYEDPEAVDEDQAADDVEGHRRVMLDDEPDEVEGHGWTHKQDPEADEDDVEGHRRFL